MASVNVGKDRRLGDTCGKGLLANEPTTLARRGLGGGRRRTIGQREMTRKETQPGRWRSQGVRSGKSGNGNDSV